MKIQKLIPRQRIVGIQRIDAYVLKKDNSIGNGETGRGMRGFTMSHC